MKPAFANSTSPSLSCIDWRDLGDEIASDLWAKSEYHSDLQGPSGSTSGPSRNIIPTYKALLGQPLGQVGISFRPTRPFWVNLGAKSEYHSDLQGPSGSTSGPSRNIIPTYKALLASVLVPGSPRTTGESGRFHLPADNSARSRLISAGSSESNLIILLVDGWTNPRVFACRA